MLSPTGSLNSSSINSTDLDPITANKPVFRKQTIFSNGYDPLLLTGHRQTGSSERRAHVTFLLRGTLLGGFSVFGGAGLLMDEGVQERVWLGG